MFRRRRSRLSAAPPCPDGLLGDNLAGPSDACEGVQRKVQILARVRGREHEAQACRAMRYSGEGDGLGKDTRLQEGSAKRPGLLCIADHERRNGRLGAPQIEAQRAQPGLEKARMLP